MMPNGRVTLQIVDKKVAMLGVTVENIDRSVSTLAKAFTRHCREHWKNLFWAIPTLLSAVQLIFLLVKSKGD
jgi:hypothetical protein